MSRGQILIVPAFEKGRGGGHLCRCMALTDDLRAMDREALLFLPAQAEETDNLFNTANFSPAWRITEDDLPRICADTVECIVLDRFQTPSEELARWKEIAPVIAIDEGGPCRDSADFLVDILVPEKLGYPQANTADPFLLKLPPAPLHQKQPAGENLKVLVSFGHEDPAGLGPAVTRSLSAMNNSGSMDITYLRGGLRKSKETEDLPESAMRNVRVFEAIPSLAERLGEYDLVITHYGITAYEALYAGAAVLLVSPTAYHEKLAKAAGFCSVKKGAGLQMRLAKNINYEQMRRKGIGDQGSGIRGVVRYLNVNSTRNAFKQQPPIPDPRSLIPKNLAILINNFSPQVNRRCPVCGGAPPERSICRFTDRTYRRCPSCGVIYMDRTCPPPVEYERDYFFDSYKQQYGKTYLEDFPNIKAVGKRRLKIIKSLLSARGGRTLLDIGCAYGPFLAAAREEGFTPAGIDPAEDAVRYVQQELGIPAVQGYFPQSLIPHSYDAVSLWYVIEHFTDCASVLAAIRGILKPGGILAFSTPSFSGISGRSSLRGFLSASPADHRTVWRPKMCKKALALAGFKVKKIVISGHHPERFVLLGKLAKSKKSPLYRPLLAISKLFGLGDTFEVYAIKN